MLWRDLIPCCSCDWQTLLWTQGHLIRWPSCRQSTDNESSDCALVFWCSLCLAGIRYLPKCRHRRQKWHICRNLNTARYNMHITRVTTDNYLNNQNTMKHWKFKATYLCTLPATNSASWLPEFNKINTICFDNVVQYQIAHSFEQKRSSHGLMVKMRNFHRQNLDILTVLVTIIIIIIVIIIIVIIINSSSIGTRDDHWQVPEQIFSVSAS